MTTKVKWNVIKHNATWLTTALSKGDVIISRDAGVYLVSLMSKGAKPKELDHFEHQTALWPTIKEGVTCCQVAAEMKWGIAADFAKAQMLTAEPSVEVVVEPVSKATAQVNKPEKKQKAKATAAEAKPVRRIKREAKLDKESATRIEKMETQTALLATKVEQSLNKQEQMGEQMIQFLSFYKEQMGVAQTPAVECGEKVFDRRAFHTIRVRLLRKAIVVTVLRKDKLGNSFQRKFRCVDWFAFCHLITTGTMRDGVEELIRKPRKVKTPQTHVGGAKKRKPLNTPGAKKALKATVAAVIPQPKGGYDATAAKLNAEQLKAQQKAEKAIKKTGSQLKDAKDHEIVSALVKCGFDKEVAFYAAENCGLVTEEYAKKFEYNRQRRLKRAAEAAALKEHDAK